MQMAGFRGGKESRHRAPMVTKPHEARVELAQDVGSPGLLFFVKRPLGTRRAERGLYQAVLHGVGRPRWIVHRRGVGVGPGVTLGAGEGSGAELTQDIPRHDHAEKHERRAQAERPENRCAKSRLAFSAVVPRRACRTDVAGGQRVADHSAPMRDATVSRRIAQLHRATAPRAELHNNSKHPSLAGAEIALRIAGDAERRSAEGAAPSPGGEEPIIQRGHQEMTLDIMHQRPASPATKKANNPRFSQKWPPL